MGAKGKRAEETPDKIKAFEVWFADPKRSFEAARRVLLTLSPPLEVAVVTLQRWAAQYGWRERARERDMEVIRQLQADAIQRKKDFLERQANVGRLLQKKGVAFLQDDQPELIDPNDPTKGYKPNKGKGGIRSDYAAIQAIQTGLNLEKVGMELPDQTSQSVIKQEVVFRVIREKRKKIAPSSSEDE